MKNLFIFAFALIMINTSDTRAQKYHTPAEIILLMSDNNAQYSIQPWTEKDRKECKDYSDILNNNNFYRYHTSEGWSIKEYKVSSKSEELMNLAEEYFSELNLDSAKKYYELVLKEEPDYYKAKTYLAQIYMLNNNSEISKNLLKEVIRDNYIDYMAHWFLADIYCYIDKDYKSAIKEICITNILNRNNPRIMEATEKIFQTAGKKFNNWCFIPQYEITRFSPTGVNLKFEQDWMMYAMTKAVWANEPNYLTIFGVNDDPFSYYEETESLINLYISHKELEKKGDKNFMKNVIFRKLREAADANMFEKFVYYEIILREYPSLAYIFTEEYINEIATYLTDIRFKE